MSKFPSYKFRVSVTKHGEIILKDGKWYTEAEVKRINAQSDVFNENLENKKEVLEARKLKIDKQIDDLPPRRYGVGGYYDSNHDQTQSVFEAHPNIDAIRFTQGNIQWRTKDGRFIYNPEES